MYGDWYLGTGWGYHTVCISEDTPPEGQWFDFYELGYNDFAYSYWCGSHVYGEFGWDFPGDYRA